MTPKWLADGHPQIDGRDQGELIKSMVAIRGRCVKLTTLLALSVIVNIQNCHRPQLACSQPTMGRTQPSSPAPSLNFRPRPTTNPAHRKIKLLMDAQGESDRARRSRPVVGDFRFFFALATRRATGDTGRLGQNSPTATRGWPTTDQSRNGHPYKH